MTRMHLHVHAMHMVLQEKTFSSAGDALPKLRLVHLDPDL